MTKRMPFGSHIATKLCIARNASSTTTTQPVLSIFGEHPKECRSQGPRLSIKSDCRLKRKGLETPLLRP